jgi:hypothetical protein
MGGVPPQSLIGVDSLFEFMLAGFMLDMSGCSPLMLLITIRLKTFSLPYRTCIHGFSFHLFYDLLTFPAPTTHVFISLVTVDGFSFCVQLSSNGTLSILIK